MNTASVTEREKTGRKEVGRLEKKKKEGKFKERKKKKGFTDVIRDGILRWWDYPKLFSWALRAKCNHVSS